MYKRIKILVISFAVIMGMLTLRVAYIQLLGHEDLSAAAEAQQNITLDGADTRGVIYDCNGTPIAGGQQEYIYIIRTEDFDGETMNALAEVDAEEIPNENSDYKVYSSEVYDKKSGERLIKNSDAFILETCRRYRKDHPAVHMIGYINSKDSCGASGIELMYDNELNLFNKKVSAAADVNGDLLHGHGLQVETDAEKDDGVKAGITSTIELGLQKKTEQILRSCSNDGAVVVVRADTGEIAAAASTPVYDPEKIEEYIESDNGELINKVTQGIYPPGSVFKIIVAAAALEAGVCPETTFKCTGSQTVNGHTVKCETGGEKGHGQISFEQAFADSCNSAFIQLGQIAGADAVIEMAEQFGLGKTVMDDFPEEQAGNVMSERDAEGAAIANLSIGQGETLVTPIQVAAMTSIVANNGTDPGIRITTSDNRTGSECISRETAMTLQQMMETTMISGTGSGIDIPVSAGAKTGSAESVQSGHEVVHGWMTGFVPAEDPQYVITVFVENGRSGRASAGPVFSQVIDYIYENGMLDYETDF